MPRLSIIIPTSDNAQALENSLVSVLENRPEDCEIIVVLTQPYDDPYDLDGEVRFVEAPPGAGWATCVDCGIAESHAAVIHVLSAGATTIDGWTDAAVAHFANPRVAAVSPVVLSQAVEALPGAEVASNRSRRVVSAGLDDARGGVRRLRTTAPERTSFVLGPTRTAGFYRRSALDIVGGGSSNAVGDELADVELALCLKRLGYVALVEPHCRVMADETSNRRCGTIAGGLCAERLFRRHLGDDGWLESTIAHAGVVAKELIGSVGKPSLALRLLGRVVACFQSSHYRDHRQWLRERALIAAADRTEQRHSDPAQRADTATGGEYEAARTRRQAA